MPSILDNLVGVQGVGQVLHEEKLALIKKNYKVLMLREEKACGCWSNMNTQEASQGS